MTDPLRWLTATEDLSIVREGPLNRFAASRINELVDSVLSTLSPDKKGAVLAIADQDGARLATMARLKEGWSVVVVGERAWNGQLSGEAALRFEW